MAEDEAGDEQFRAAAGIRRVRHRCAGHGRGAERGGGGERGKKQGADGLARTRRVRAGRQKDAFRPMVWSPWYWWRVVRRA